MNTRMKKQIATIAVIASIIIVAIVVIAGMVIEKNTPSDERMSLADYYAVPENEAMLIFDDKVYEKNALWYENHPYLDLETVMTTFNHRFFWSENENLLLYTTPTEIIQITPGELQYVVNGEARNADYAPAAKNNGSLYISIEYLAQYADYQYQIYNEPNRVMLQYRFGEYLYSDVLEPTQVRVSNNIKSEILADVDLGDRLIYIDGGGIQENGFVKVMTDDGVRGYIKKDKISDSYYAETTSSFIMPEYTHILKDEPVYLGWELLYTTDSVGILDSHLRNAQEVNVVSPTWFYLTDTEGSMRSYANHAYVETAHDRGVDVWALFKNDNIEDVFSCTEDTHTLLSSFESRSSLIANMVSEVEEYNIDGINIDFEMLKTDTGIYFIQFLRELSVACRNNGIVLSVDNYVPASYNAFYDLAEQGVIVDYVIIMGYDEHYAGSPEAGSVASMPWYAESINNTLEKVPSEQIIMGLPFYTRLWKEVEQEDGSVALTVEANPGMDMAAETLAAYGVTPEFDDETGQYYGEYTRGDALYRIWLEEEESIASRAKLIKEAGCAGVAAWKLGDESAGTWKIIRENFEGTAADDVQGAE